MNEECKSISLSQEVCDEFIEAKRCYEVDTGKEISFNDFLNVLVTAYNVYREKRGASESLLLNKMISKEETVKNS